MHMTAIHNTLLLVICLLLIIVFIIRGRAVSPGMSPSGQNSSPVPPTFAVEAEKVFTL